MPHFANLIPRLQLKLAEAQTDGEIIKPYFEFASAHGAHSDLSREVWEKVQRVTTKEKDESEAEPHQT